MPTDAPQTLLLTPGPLTTSPQTRAALGRDWGSRDADFTAMSEAVRGRLAILAGVAETHAAIPVQGSGTFAVEAMIQSLVPRDGTLLVLVNGAYGRRIVEIARRCRRATVVLDAPEDQPIDPAAVRTALADPAITDVALVHVETTSGLLNPLPEIATIVQSAGRRLLLDAMSAFGAVPIDGTPLAALAGSSNKGLEGVPGLAFVIARRDLLAGAAGRADSLSLDLVEQWRGFEANGQWRFTPPVQVVAALSSALDQLDAEGGIAARYARYCANRDTLLAGMTRLGFQSYLLPEHQAPVIATFRIPSRGFDFDTFYGFLHDRGIVIYPGKLTREPSFRIGCIGAISPGDIDRALTAIGAYVSSPQQGDRQAG